MTLWRLCSRHGGHRDPWTCELPAAPAATSKKGGAPPPVPAAAGGKGAGPPLPAAPAASSASGSTPPPAPAAAGGKAAGRMIDLTRDDLSQEQADQESRFASVFQATLDIIDVDASDAPSSSEEDTAAPAAAHEGEGPGKRPRLSYNDACGRMLFMSWNAGGGARRIKEVIEGTGYHVVAIQEARMDWDFLGSLDPNRWCWSHRERLFIAVRTDA